jgi:hypothetical protein
MALHLSFALQQAESTRRPCEHPEAVCKRNEQRLATLHSLVAIDVHT